MNDIHRPKNRSMNDIRRPASQASSEHLSQQQAPTQPEIRMKHDRPADMALPSINEAAREASSRPVKKTPKRRWLWILVLLCTLLIAIAMSGAVWYNSQLSSTDSQSHQHVVVRLEQGSTAGSVGALLQKNGLIKNAQAFELYLRLTKLSGKLQAGVYRIAKSSDVPAIVTKLTTGKTDTFTITFLPGATLAKHRKVLIEAGYSETEVDAALKKPYTHPLLASKPSNADLEGYIYGETYKMPSDATAEQVIERTFDEFYKAVKLNNLIEKYKQRNFTLHQGIIMASIIQREVGKPEKDQAMVAGVFYNRLAKGMNLGSDVTYQYIADKTGVARDPALQSDYNTRIHTGLTPGPIASPGKGALLAAANPEKHDYIFFLSGDDDVTYFGTTDADHQRNIREHCQKKCQIL